MQDWALLTVRHTLFLLGNKIQQLLFLRIEKIETFWLLFYSKWYFVNVSVLITSSSLLVIVKKFHIGFSELFLVLLRELMLRMKTNWLERISAGKYKIRRRQMSSDLLTLDPNQILSHNGLRLSIVHWLKVRERHCTNFINIIGYSFDRPRVQQRWITSQIQS